MTSRQTALAGTAFGPLFIAALLLASTPDTGESDAYWSSYFATGDHQARLIISGALLILAALAHVFFMTGLRDRTGAGALPAGFATMAAALMSVAGLLTLMVPSVAAEGARYLPDADVLRLLTEVGYAVLAFCAMPAAAIALAQTLRAGGLPRPLVIAGLVICVLQIGAIYYLPMLLFGVWSIAVAAVLARRPLRIPSVMAEA
jgi:hypothetical protein